VTIVELESTRILAISGSLQSRSSNTAVVRLAAKLADDRTYADAFEALADLPYFNPELDIEPAPRTVANLRARVGSADAVLIASPEYARNARRAEKCPRLAGELGRVIRQASRRAVRCAES
jgi:chromate reductase, NAD(P)H dehydrogenase (quinone)